MLDKYRVPSLDRLLRLQVQYSTHQTETEWIDMRMAALCGRLRTISSSFLRSASKESLSH
jgi:hypothetical protein